MKHSEERNEKDLMVMVPLVKEIDFFKKKNIQGQDLVQICQELKHEFYREGEAVFKQGEYGDKFYVILKGEVGVKIPDPKRRLEQAQKQQQAAANNQGGGGGGGSNPAGKEASSGPHTTTNKQSEEGQQ